MGHVSAAKLPSEDVAGGQAGEPVSVDLNALYARYWQELCNYLRRTFGAGPPEPEDIAQATFAKFAAVPEPEAVANPRAFLYATARNLVHDYFRHQRYRDSHVQDVQHTADHQILYEISPERVLLDRERVHLLTAALARLPLKTRRMILLHRFEGLTHAEIAKRFGVSTSLVQKKIEQALEECNRYMNSASEDRKKP